MTNFLFPPSLIFFQPRHLKMSKKSLFFKHKHSSSKPSSSSQSHTASTSDTGTLRRPHIIADDISDSDSDNSIAASAINGAANSINGTVSNWAQNRGNRNDHTTRELIKQLASATRGSIDLAVQETSRGLKRPAATSSSSRKTNTSSLRRSSTNGRHRKVWPISNLFHLFLIIELQQPPTTSTFWVGSITLFPFGVIKVCLFQFPAHHTYIIY